MNALQRLRSRQPGRPYWRILSWYTLQIICFVVCLPLYRYRTWGVRNVPRKGPVLYVANHESFLDAVVLGIGTHRRHFNVMARETLFGNGFLKVMGVILNAIPLAQGAGDVKAIRECIKVLDQGHALLVYPEGARTYDGKMHTFKTGVMLIIRKAKPTVVPVSIIGAYDIWPRTQKLPHLRGRLGAVFADPIAADDLIKLGPDTAIAHLKKIIADNRLEYRRKLGLPDLPEPVAEHPTEKDSPPTLAG